MKMEKKNWRPYLASDYGRSRFVCNFFPKSDSYCLKISGRFLLSRLTIFIIAIWNACGYQFVNRWGIFGESAEASSWACLCSCSDKGVKEDNCARPSKNETLPSGRSSMLKMTQFHCIVCIFLTFRNVTSFPPEIRIFSVTWLSGSLRTVLTE